VGDGGELLFGTSEGFIMQIFFHVAIMTSLIFCGFVYGRAINWFFGCS
jgi:hypothetical protein